MTASDHPPTKEEMDQLYVDHYAKRNREMDKLQVEVGALREATALQRTLEERAKAKAEAEEVRLRAEVRRKEAAAASKAARSPGPSAQPLGSSSRSFSFHVPS